MKVNMKEKANLERLSKEELAEVSVFIGALSERFRCMTETVEAINYRTDRFIKDFYAKERAYSGHSARG